MAINDGVLESYLDAMLADPKMIRHFYNRTAYLRDSEHPGILKTYIQGIKTGHLQCDVHYCFNYIIEMYSDLNIIFC